MALKRLLLKADVRTPGARGGKFWRDDKGKVRYGDKPNYSAKELPDVVEPKQHKHIPSYTNTDEDGVTTEVGPKHGTKVTLEKLRRLGKGKGRHVDLTRAELEQVLNTGKFALVSAGTNPNHEEDKHLTEDEVRERHKKLGEDLKQEGFAFTNVQGHYGGIEDSYLVMIHDADRDYVRKVGKKFNQDSVIYGEDGKWEMHYTVGEHADKNEMLTGKGWEAKDDAEDYYTAFQHPDGSTTKFSLNFDWDNYQEFKKAFSQMLLLKATKKPYGHTAYTRTSKTGKVVRINAKGAKPVDAPKPVSTQFKLGDLPRDMREEMFNLHATSVNPDATEREFNRKTVPSRDIDISQIDVSSYSKDATDKYDPETLPPIVVAGGKLIDGGHRVAAAQRKGIKTLRAIDMTGLLDPASTGFVGDLKKAEPTKKPDGEEGPNDHIGEQVDAPVGYAPRVVKVPMHPGADVNPKVHAAKQEEAAMKKPKPNVKKSTAIECGPTPSVTLMKATKTGEGSRGGKVVRHTKGGKPVYQSQAEREAHTAGQMADKWHHNASGTGNPEHHAIAAKQNLHAAYFHHHAGDEVASHSAMDYAAHHRAAYEHAGHTSRTTTAVSKMHHQTAHEVGHSGWSPASHGLGEDHQIAADAEADGRHKVAKKIRAEGNAKKKGKVLGKTRNGHEVRDISEHNLKQMEGYNKHNFKDITTEEHVAHRAGREAHHKSHGHYKGWKPEDHLDAGELHRKASSDATMAARDADHPHPSQSHATQVHRGLASDHNRAYEERSGYHGGISGADQRLAHNGPVADAAVEKIMKKSVSYSDFKKAISPSNTGGNMSKNEVSDLFKSELGVNAEAPITTCVHCSHALTKSDLAKGLGTHFVADDNDNPSSGGSGQVEASRPGAGVSENDVIAPLLKGLKGPEAGDKEEFPISKSEMLTMGMNVDDMDDGYYTITKGEMKAQGAEAHIAFLANRKNDVAKSMKPDVVRKSVPQTYSPRAGGAHGANGEQLVQWSQGTDAETAKYIEQNGAFGQGSDELIRTEGRGV